MRSNQWARRPLRQGRWPQHRRFWRRVLLVPQVVARRLRVVRQALQGRLAVVLRLRAPVLALPLPQRLGRPVVRRVRLAARRLVHPVPVHPLALLQLVGVLPRAADKLPVLPRPRRELLMVRNLQSRQRTVEVVVLLADLRVLRGVDSNPYQVRTQNRVQRVPSRMRVPRRVIAARVRAPAQMAAVTKAPKVFLPLAV